MASIAEAWDGLINPSGHEELSDGGKQAAAGQDLANNLGGVAVGATVGAYTGNAAAGAAANEFTYSFLDGLTAPILKAIDKASESRQRLHREQAMHTVAETLTEAGWSEAEIATLPDGGQTVSPALIGQVQARMQAAGASKDEIAQVRHALYQIADSPV